MLFALGLFCLHALSYLVAGSFASSDWDYLPTYGHVDPTQWHVKYKLCKGQHQSPVGIDYRDLVYDPALASLRFSGYDESISGASLSNNGHTIQFDIPSSSNASLKSDSLDSTYRLKQFHFHWSHRDDTGSEHVVDSKHYPLELHFVHVDERTGNRDSSHESQHQANVDDESKIDQTASSKKYNFVVVGVMFNVIEDDDFDHYQNVHVCKEMQKIAGLLPRVELEGSRVDVDTELSIGNLLPKDSNGYLRYSGSLTTPPCSETVEWILLTKTLNLSRSQIDQFRSIKHNVPVRTSFNSSSYVEAEMVLDENVRPLQHLNQRSIRLRRELGDLFPGRNLPRMIGGSKRHAANRLTLFFFFYITQQLFFTTLI